MTATTVDRAERFAAYLSGLAQREDRAALAALRRGLGKPAGTAPEMYPYIVPWLSPSASRWEEDAVYLVASLFALHPLSWPEGDSGARSFGSSFGRLARLTGSEGPERRFVALLGCPSEGLPDHLRQAVGLLKSKLVPVHWAQLLRDIRNWSSERRTVQRRWARDFWGTPAPEDADLVDSPTDQEEED